MVRWWKGTRLVNKNNKHLRSSFVTRRRKIRQDSCYIALQFNLEKFWSDRLRMDLQRNKIEILGCLILTTHGEPVLLLRGSQVQQNHRGQLHHQPIRGMASCIRPSNNEATDSLSRWRIWEWQTWDRKPIRRQWSSRSLEPVLLQHPIHQECPEIPLEQHSPIWDIELSGCWMASTKRQDIPREGEATLPHLQIPKKFMPAKIQKGLKKANLAYLADKMKGVTWGRWHLMAFSAFFAMPWWTRLSPWDGSINWPMFETWKEP